MADLAKDTPLQPDGDEGVQPEASNPEEGAEKTGTDVQESLVEKLQKQLQSMQAAKDREIAAVHAKYQGQVSALEKDRGTLEATLEAVLPEEERAKYELARIKNERDALRAEQARNSTLTAIAKEYDVPMEVLSTARTKDEMTVLAMNHLRDALRQATQAPASNPRKEQAQAAKASGGTTTVIEGRAPAADPARAIMTEARFKELQERAALGRREARAAALEYLKTPQTLRQGDSEV